MQTPVDILPSRHSFNIQQNQTLNGDECSYNKNILVSTSKYLAQPEQSGARTIFHNIPTES
jgi:hypothetical protein